MSILSKTISGSTKQLAQLDAFIILPSGNRQNIVFTSCEELEFSMKFDSIVCKTKSIESYNVSITTIDNVRKTTNTFPGIANYNLKKKIINVSIFSYNDVTYNIPNFPKLIKDVLIDSQFQLCECPKIKGRYNISGITKVNKVIPDSIFGITTIAFNNLYIEGNLKIN